MIRCQNSENYNVDHRRKNVKYELQRYFRWCLSVTLRRGINCWCYIESNFMGLWSDNWKKNHEGCRKGTVGIFLEGLRKTTRNLNHDRRWSGQDSNQASRAIVIGVYVKVPRASTVWWSQFANHTINSNSILLCSKLNCLHHQECDCQWPGGDAHIRKHWHNEFLPLCFQHRCFPP